MRDEDWTPNGRGRWTYTDYSKSKWVPEVATIFFAGTELWHLFINTQHIATFNSWAEARDATPMMMKLHGQESEA